ncbi:GNAT family N-acetyltransferase [Jatrophihabitans endophyticus]|uniref:GNAT family N-acetyltransferase n=1 Tax=Jatrophihabitans endophyticus TaxID=1206085 RepID=UPI0019DD88E8|nr:GNAT family N-acetyltransferase [Jatrophihabitans endophyticus]MBE7187460.1 GNAT family N-acetyltransferase [Jatrophihabitans endophyticus]
MPRRVVGIGPDTVADLPDGCRGCAFWELSPLDRRHAQDNGTEALDKEAWVSDTALEWGACGQLVYVDDVPAGYVLYAPPAYVPRADSFATSPPSPDALLLMTGRIRSEFAGQGLGRVLIQSAVREAAQRGVRALEAFGRVTGPPAGPASDSQAGCLLPVGYLTAVGFKTVRAHATTPRLRLDVRTAVSWRADVEYAIERLFGTIPSAVATR